MDKRYQHFIEAIPGLITWTFIIGMIILSFFAPEIASYIVVFYCTYFIYQSISTVVLMFITSRKVKRVMHTNWVEELEKAHSDWKEYYHTVIMPFANETEEVLTPSIESIVNAHYPNEKVILVLASEERLEKGFILAEKLKSIFTGKFLDILITRHPIKPGEIIGKASNENYAARLFYDYAQEKQLDPNKLLISVCDCDSRYDPEYFGRLMYVYLEQPEKEKKIYQPLPFYFSNLWNVTFISRIIATFSAQWQLALTLKPHRYINFSSYAILLETLNTIGYWNPDIIPEDERLFWRALRVFGQSMQVVPLFIPILQDAVFSNTFLKSLKAQYLQVRRWAWGASEIGFSIPAMYRNKNVPFSLKFVHLSQQIRKNFEWAMAPFILTFGLSFPSLINPGFAKDIVSYEIPLIMSRILLFSAALTLTIFYVEALFAPPRPTEWSIVRRGFSMISWLAFPFVSIIFSAIPAIEAQTRLIIGKPIQYVVAEKGK